MVWGERSLTQYIINKLIIWDIRRRSYYREQKKSGIKRIEMIDKRKGRTDPDHRGRKSNAMPRRLGFILSAIGALSVF